MGGTSGADAPLAATRAPRSLSKLLPPSLFVFRACFAGALLIMEFQKTFQGVFWTWKVGLFTSEGSSETTYLSAQCSSLSLCSLSFLCCPCSLHTPHSLSASSLLHCLLKLKPLPYRSIICAASFCQISTPGVVYCCYFFP